MYRKKNSILCGSVLLLTAAVFAGNVVHDREAGTVRTMTSPDSLGVVPASAATGPTKVLAEATSGDGTRPTPNLPRDDLRRNREEGDGKSERKRLVVFRRCLREPLSTEALLRMTNDARTAQGLDALDESPLLDAVAEARARDMAEKDYFAHVSPTGERVSHVAQRVGYRYRLMSENIAAGGFRTNRAIVDCWLGSQVHRRNVLSHRIKEMGASIVRGRINGTEMWVAVQVFGLPSALASGPPFVPSYSPFSDFRTIVEKLRGTRRELDLERESIERSLGSLTDEPEGRERLNTRIAVYNEKADRYNRSLFEMTAVKSSLNSAPFPHSPISLD